MCGQCVFSVWSVCVQFVFSVCSVCVQCVFSVCSVCVPGFHTATQLHTSQFPLTHSVTVKGQLVKTILPGHSVKCLFSDHCHPAGCVCVVGGCYLECVLRSVCLAVCVCAI